MDSNLVLLFLAILAVIFARATSRSPQPPQVIYVQAETPRHDDIGCLALIITGLLLLRLLGAW